MTVDDPLSPDDADAPEADLLPDDPSEGLGVDDPSEGLSVDDPSEGLGPEIPQAPEFSDEDAPSELKRQFWSLVLLFNVALFGMGLGVMLVGFEGRWRFGGALFAVGAFAFVRGWFGYRKATEGGWSEDDAEAATSEDDAETTLEDAETTLEDAETTLEDAETTPEADTEAAADESVRKD